MDKHKSAVRETKLNTYKPRSLAIKQKWGNLQGNKIVCLLVVYQYLLPVHSIFRFKFITIHY